ncbi:MAG: dihydroxyacetone kinase, partial [Candidatus Nanopelagicales bacterium]
MASSRPSPEARHHRSPRAAPLHAAAIRAWAEASLAAIGQERAAIDALNVFPVPDGDTGTNMFLTVESACAAIEEV